MVLPLQVKRVAGRQAERAWREGDEDLSSLTCFILTGCDWLGVERTSPR